MANKLFRLIVPIILVLLLKQGLAQKTGSADFFIMGINSGLYNMGSADELYSPYLYSGKSTTYGLKFLNGNTKKWHQLDLRYAFLNREIKSITFNPSLFTEKDFNLMKASFIFEAIDHYNYLIPSASGGFFKLFASGTWFTTVNISTNAYSLPELIQTGLGAGITAQGVHKSHSLTASLLVPVIALTVRNNYSLSMTQDYEKLDRFAFIVQNAQLQSVHNLWAVHTNLNYAYRFSKRFSAEANYHFRFMNNASPRPLRSVNGVYTLGLIFQFK